MGNLHVAVRPAALLVLDDVTSGVPRLADFVALDVEPAVVRRLTAGVPALLPVPGDERGRDRDRSASLLESVLLPRIHDGDPVHAGSSPLRVPARVPVVGLVDLAGGAASARMRRQDAELDRLGLLAALGDRIALEQLLGLVRPLVMRYCRARLGSRGAGLQTAEDVAQEVLLSLCGALSRYQRGKTHLMAFVYGIASNKVVDAFRAAGRDHSDPTDGLPDSADLAPGPESAVVLRARIDELTTLLDLLPVEHREILVMRIAMQFSAEETARVIGSTAGAVRVAQHRALAKLRALVAADRLTTSPRFDL